MREFDDARWRGRGELAFVPGKTKSATSREVGLTPQAIERRIFLVRGHRVMLDRDLAEMYGVTTKALNQAVEKQRTLSDRFRVSADDGGGRALEVTICDLK